MSADRSTLLILASVIAVASFGFMVSYMHDIEKKKQCGDVDPKMKETLKVLSIVGLSASVIALVGGLGMAAKAKYNA